jgi:ornithine cyclodeaminase/alanine dehydrogenase-like protein (mu-crystallin family)
VSTALRIIDADTIRRLAPPERLIGWMREAMVAVSRRDVVLPLRQGMSLPEGAGAIGIMPGFVGGSTASAGVKLVSLVPPERRKGSSHLGLMVLYDAEGLVPQAILCGATITALRTAAVSAMATDTLSRPDAHVLAVLGAGEQAKAHIDALRQVRSFDDVRIWARRFDAAQALAIEIGGTAMPSIEATVAGADVICTTTSAREPILTGALVQPGAHVNLVGSSFPEAREVDDELVAKSRFFIDFLPSTMAQAGEFLHALQAGMITERHIAGEIGAVLDGKVEGRQTAQDITVYKSLGVAAQDIVTARAVFTLAEHAKLGVVAAI